MIAALLFAQVMVETLDTRPQPAVPATAFRCTFIRAGQNEGAVTQFDLYGTTPLAPEGHQPNARFPLVLGSATDSPLAGRGSVNPIRSGDWFREFQISRSVGEESYVINLKLRREGRSVAYMTVYSDWPANARGEREPYRYDAVGLCTADFNPSEQPS